MNDSHRMNAENKKQDARFLWFVRFLKRSRTQKRGRLRQVNTEALESRLLLSADFLDAPISFSSYLEDDGPHQTTTGQWLGSSHDLEINAIRSAGANSGVNTGEADEDGMAFSQLRSGTLQAIPDAPEFLDVSGRGENWIRLDWSDAPGAINYYLERYDPISKEWKQIYYARESHYLDRGTHLIPGISYQYRVRSENAERELSEYSMLVEESIITGRGRIEGKFWIGREEIFSENEFDVSILSHSDHGINEDRNTWILIHGWGGLNPFSGFNPITEGWIDSFSETLNRLYPEDTILSYNWHDASNTGPNAGISEARIPFAAEWLGLHLWELGFGEKLKFVGHSHGAYVANEAAKVIPVKERAIIAIDPADDAPGALDINAITNFRESACLTWAFVDGDRVGANVGNVLTAATASHSFLVKNTTHTRLPKFVENLISNQTLASKYFSFDNLSVLDHENIWIENAFDGNGDEDRNNGEHEAVFWSDSNDHVERFRIRDVRTSDNRYEDYPVDQSLVNIQFSGFGPSTFENIAPSTFDDTASSGVFADSVSESFSIREAYQNFAPQPTGQFDVVYYASRTGLSTTPLFELAHRTVTNLDVLGISGSTQSFSYDQIPVEAISGGRTYVGVAKNPAEVQSADDILWFNMDIPASFGQPDLIVEDFAIEPVAAAYAWSRSLESSFRIQNVGSGYAGPFTAKIFLSADPQITTTDYYLGEHRFDGLQGRSTTGTSILFSLPESLPSGASDGTYYLGVIADPENSVTEGDDTNNSNRGEGSDRKEIVINSNLPANGEPVISSLSVDPSVVVRGEFITFLASGVADDEHVNDVRFFQETSGNGVLDEDDLLVGYGSYSELTTEYRLRTMSSHLQLGSSKIYAQATDNEGNLSAVVSVPIVINGNGPAVPDEYEFNNDLSTAHYLGSSANFQLNGSITPDDRDFFVFDMPLGEADISVGLSFFEETDGRGDLTLELRRMTGATTSSQVGFSDRSQPGQTGESISIADASKGRYVVIVNGQNNAANPYYSLSVVLHPRSGAPRVGDLVISSSAVHAGEQVDVWFESVSGSLGGNDGAAFYLDDDSSGKITGSETLLGVDYGSQPSLNGKFGTSFNTSGFSAGIHLIHGYIFSSFGESVPRTAVLEIVPNEVPVIGNLNAPSTLKAGEAGRILVEGVSDVDGEVVSVSVFRDSNGDGRWSGDDLRLGDATLINGSWELDFNTSQWERSTHLLFALAVDDDGEESTPESVNVEILPVPPDAPDGVRATGGGYTDRVVVNWLESDSADRYIVYRSENVEEAAGTEIGLTQALQFEDHSGIKGRTYRYWVVAANDDGISELSSYTTGFRNAPDLVPIVAEVNGVFTSGQTISVNSVIQNLSTATADSAQLSFYFSENDTITPLDRLIKTIQLPIVSGSATFDWVEALEIPEDMPGGEYFVGIIVDVEDSLPELNDFNNAFAGDNFFVNIPPAISVTALLGQMAEDQHINDRIKVAQFDVKDDGIGLNEVSLSGPDAALFEIDGADLFLKANASLDFETNPILDVVVQVDDTSVGNTPDDTAELSINVTDVNEAPTLEFSQTVTELIENTDTSNAIKVADIVVTDDALGSNVLSLTGADANLFDIIGTELFLKGGVVLDYEQQTELQVIVQVDDVAIGDSPDAQQSLTISLIDTTRIDITSSSLGYGIPGQDNATGAGFILYSQQSVQQRFAGAVVANGAENFVVVRYLNNQWQYANNDVWVDFTPTTGDRLIAAVDFDSSQVQMLQGSSGSVNGINQGYVEGDLTITPNQWRDRPNAGEFGITGTYFILEQTTTRVTIAPSSLGYGIPGQDNATGAGFILYSQQSVQQRFAGAVVANGAEHFVVVRFISNQWQYANNDVWVDFTPTTGDRLIAAINFDSSQVQMLLGSSGSVNGINQGYVEGDLTITPNQWRDRPNAGEFGITGTYFILEQTTTRVTIAPSSLGYGIPGQDNATGAGFILYSQQSVQQRFAGAVVANGAEHFVVVRFISNQWQYANNDVWVDFTPTTGDRLIAAINFDSSQVQMLQGNSGSVNGINQGYVEGDLTITPNQWRDRPNAGEFGITGTYFTMELTTVRINIAPSSLGYGIPSQDNATGNGFILYSQQSVQQRFAGAVVANGAEHFVVVRYLSNQWQYAHNDIWVDFTPTTGDRLIAAIDFDSSQVQMLQGSSGSVNGIAQGYVESDLTITPNQWRDRPNAGEFGITGTYFTVLETPPQTTRVDITPSSLGYGIPGQDNAIGAGFILYSQQSVQQRFAGAVVANGAEHFVVVRYLSNQWQYANNDIWVDFTPTTGDRLIAAIDFGSSQVEMLQGSSGSVNGINQGYLESDLTITANQWRDVFNQGEFGIAGTYFTFE